MAVFLRLLFASIALASRPLNPPVAKPTSFDPKNLPFLGVDSHLRAVPLSALQPAALQQRFAAPPVWAPEVRAERSFTDRMPLRAAVLVPIVMREQLTVLLTERTTHLSSHSGQIAFPGGKTDEEDADATATALREAFEEVGLDPAFVQVLGALPEYITGSAFVVTPVVALVRPGFKVIPSANEVADVFEVPLAFLMNPAHHRRQALEWEGVRREWFAMPYQDELKQRFIWGATAGMLRNLYRLLLA